MTRTYGDTTTQAEAGDDVEPGVALMWLEEVYSLVSQGDPDAAVDILFARIDTLLAAGEYQRCDAVLRAVDPKRLDTVLLVAALSVTKRAATSLSARADFVRRVRMRLDAVAPGRVERLLAGLI